MPKCDTRTWHSRTVGAKHCAAADCVRVSVVCVVCGVVVWWWWVARQIPLVRDELRYLQVAGRRQIAVRPPPTLAQGRPHLVMGASYGEIN